MTDLPANPQGKKPPKQIKGPLSLQLRKAIRLLFIEGYDQTRAAREAGISREWLNKALKTDRAQAYMREFTKRTRTSDLLPPSLITVKSKIEQGDSDLAMIVLKEEGVVSHPRGSSHIGGAAGANGVQLTVVIAPQHAAGAPQDVVQGVQIEGEAVVQSSEDEG